MKPNTACAIIAAAAASSRARETANPAWPPAPIARKIPARRDRCAGALVQMGPAPDRSRQNGTGDEIARNPFLLPGQGTRPRFFEGYLDDIRKKGSSIGAVIEVERGKACRRASARRSMPSSMRSWPRR